MKIAFIGTGLMGHPMALRLMAAGHQLTVFNRTPRKTDDLKSRGARVAASPAEAVAGSDTIMAMLTDHAAIHNVLFKKPNPSFRGKTIIQMGTISCQQSIQLHTKFQDLGADYVEAPVLGSIPQVEAGTLIVLFGGTCEQFSRFDSLLAHFGEKRIWLGPVGQAMAVKLALNQLIALLTTAFSTSLGFLIRKKVNIDQFMDILRHSALYAPTFDKKRTRMLERNFNQPNFPVQHLLKDLELIIEEFSGQKIAVGPLQAIATLLRESLQKGYEGQDYSVLYNVINPK